MVGGAGRTAEGWSRAREPSEIRLLEYNFLPVMRRTLNEGSAQAECARLPNSVGATVAYRAEAPETISMISLVMAAWRMRFMFRVSEEIKSPAFFEAASIAVIRAPCSEATDSSRARKICVSTKRGSKRLKISAGGCS